MAESDLSGHKAQLFVAMHASEPLWTCYIWPAIVGSWGERMRRREIIALISSAAAALPLAAALTSIRS